MNLSVIRFGREAPAIPPLVQTPAEPAEGSVGYGPLCSRTVSEGDHCFQQLHSYVR